VDILILPYKNILPDKKMQRQAQNLGINQDASLTGNGMKSALLISRTCHANKE
jgi:hypothetical protein